MHLQKLFQLLIIATSTANQFKFQILDNKGTSFNDSWQDVCTITFDITTKKAKLNIKDSLFIDTTDILTPLYANANTSALSSYAYHHLYNRMH